MYLREDGTPYYVGKGKDKRAYTKRRRLKVPSKDRIVFPYTNLTEEDAFQKEIELIAKYGRKDIGTGILRNMTDGGEGATGLIFTQEMRDKISRAYKGHKGHTGRKHTAEVKEIISRTSRERMTVEKRREMSNRFKGSKLTEEHKQKIKIALKNYITSEVLEKRRIRATGKKHTLESKQKVSMAKKNTMFINNGVRCILIKKDESMPDGWIKGRMKKTCPNCKRHVDVGAVRWHFDNCRYNKLQTKALQAQNAGLDNFLSD